jgi:hypothetical protein
LAKYESLLANGFVAGVTTGVGADDNAVDDIVSVFVFCLNAGEAETASAAATAPRRHTTRAARNCARMGLWLSLFVKYISSKTVNQNGGAFFIVYR